MAPGPRLLLQAGGRVDDISGDRGLAAIRIGREVEQHLSRRDADAHSEVLAGLRLVDVLDGPARGECRSQRPLGVVFVGDRRAEDAEDRIADELLDRAAKTLELRADTAVVRRQQAADVFWVELLCEAREAHEVDEDNRDDLPLGGGTRLRVLKAHAAGPAEAATCRILLATPGAGRHRQQSMAWPRAICNTRRAA